MSQRDCGKFDYGSSAVSCGKRQQRSEPSFPGPCVPTRRNARTSGAAPSAVAHEVVRAPMHSVFTEEIFQCMNFHYAKGNAHSSRLS